MFFKKTIAFSCCLLALCLFFNRIYAQTSPPAVPQFALRTDLIPPSPNAASLGKFGAVPVSLSTGVPNISIPLTEAVGKQLKVPITLNYHNNGFKPTEEASWVGYGFSLDAGGVITRTVKDKVDGDIFIGPDGQYDHVDWRFHQPDSITQDFLDHVMWNQSYDVEPDIYTYNFCGYAGKFILYNNKAYQYPYQQLTIIKETAVDGFTIITPDGTAYRFWQPETTTPLDKDNDNADRPKYTPPNPYTSSWYLLSMTSADLKDVINFSYSIPQVIPQNGPASQTLTINVTDPLWGYDLSQLKFTVPTRVNSRLLTKITTSKMHIDFNQSPIIRQDVTGGALDNIMVYNYQEELINKFKFNLDYFNTASTTKDTKRMRLSSVDEGLTAGKLKKHYFFYNTDLTESKSHPGVDHWGYSNGSSTSVLIPAKFYPGGANKDPDFSHANQGMLNRIVYPTGGSSVLEFEPNLYNNDHSVNYVYNDLYANLDANRADTTTTNVITQSTSFYINEAQMVYLNYSRNPKAIYIHHMGPGRKHLPKISPMTLQLTPAVMVTG